MDSSSHASPQAAEAAPPPSKSDLPTFTRKATGLVRQVGSLDMFVFNATSTSPIGTVLVFGLVALILFPRANIYISFLIAILGGVFVWTTFALMSAAIPRIGGDYTFNSRILHPWVAMGATLCALISSCIAAGVFAYYVAAGALSPIFTVIGAVAGSKTLTNWGNFFSASHRTVVFITALISLLVLAGLALRGTRVVARVMTVLILIAVAGFVIDTLILLFTSNASFRGTIDHVAGHGAYARTVAAGAKQGLYASQGGYSGHSTIGAVYYALTVTVFTWWGTYLSAEFKGAGRRSRQLKMMVGSGVGQGLLAMLCIFIFLHTVGQNFFMSALNGNYTGKGASTIAQIGYGYFASIVSGSTPIVAILALMFFGWWLPQSYVNSAMVQRALFTWSFDGLLPRWVSAVDRRFHSPIAAITLATIGSAAGAAWASYSSNFFQVFAIMTFFAMFPIVFVGLSAIVMRWRRPDLYVGTPAEWKVGGVHILPVAGTGCLITGGGAIFLALYFHTNLGIKYFTAAWVTPLCIFAFAGLWWLVAKAVRRSQGIDLSAAYKVIPPD